MKKMVGFGDYLLRLNPEGYLRFIQADHFQINYTGAEANVCVSLAMMGMDTEFVTRLPDNDIAACGVAELRKFNVGTIPSVCIKACRKAKEMGLTVSCDLNYRKNLWTEAEANACMVQMMPYIDVLVANEEDAEKVLGIKARDTDVTQGKLNREGYIDVAEQICQTYGTKMVAVTLRRSISASDNEWSAMLYTNGKPYFSKQYMIHLVDRVGGGDSFTAGLLYGIMNDYGPQETIEYAAAASCLKQTIELDFNLSTADEVERLVGGDGSGRVQR